MKKIFLSLCLLMLSLTAFAEDYYKKMPNGEYTINEKCDKSREQKWKLIEEWIGINFKPSEVAVQKNETDGRYTVNWEIKGEPFSKYTQCKVAAVYLIDITDDGYSVKVRKPQCILNPTGFPHQYVMPYRSSVKNALKQFIEKTSEKYYNKSLSWEDDQHIVDLETELYEESLRLPRQADGTPKPSKRYFIMVEKHNICETVRGSVMKANKKLLEDLHKVMTE